MTTKKMLEELINELALLCESKEQRFFHRTYAKVKVGTVLKRGPNPLSGEPKGMKEIEMALEKRRKEKYPNRPSRLTSIYLSTTIESAFVDYGPAYEVEPIGDIFITDSMIFSKLYMKFGMWNDWDAYDRKRVMESKLLDQYWKGTTQAAGPTIEALVSQAKIIGKPKTSVIESDDTLDGSIQMTCHVYEKKKKTGDMIAKALEQTNGITVKKVINNDIGTYIIITLDAPWKIKVTETHYDISTGTILAFHAQTKMPKMPNNIDIVVSGFNNNIKAFNAGMKNSKIKKM